jgi:hypothetical protein
MTRTQIQLPDEISLAEIARRGIELFIARFPTDSLAGKDWTLPQFDAGGILAPLEKLHEIATEEEGARSIG